MSVAGHECYHYIKNNNSKSAKALADFVLSELKKNSDFDYDAMIEQYRETYGKDKSVDYLEEELVSDSMFGVFTEENVKKLCNENRSLAEKIKDFLVDFIKTIKDKAGQFTNVSKYLNDTQVQNISDMFLEALKNTQKNNTVNGGEMKYAIMRDSKGNSYWQIETEKDIFSGLKSEFALKKAAYNHILNGYKGENVIELVKGKPLKFIRISAKEFVYGVSNKKLTDKQYNQKMRMSASIDDLIKNATINYDAPDHKNHELFPNGFSNYQGRVGIDETIFKYIVRVGKGVNDEIFYDINLEVDAKVPRANSTSLIKPSTSNDTKISQNNESVNSSLLKKSKNDTKYLDLAKNPETNQTELQKMVDEAAKEAGYNIKAYHGTPNGTFNVFKDWQYFTENKEYADNYQNQGASSNGYKKTADNPKTYDVYISAKNIFDTRKQKCHKIFMEEFYQQWGNGAPLSEKGLPDWTDGEDLVEFFEDKGYDFDAIYLDEGGTGGYGEDVKSRGVSLVVKKSAQIKSADTVTYDDNGEIIPLSERFNSDNDDIRFSKNVLEDMRETAKRKAFNDSQAEDIYNLLLTVADKYTENITGDAAQGDKVAFVEAKFTGSFKSPKFSHFELVKGTIIKDSYGTDKQQHTFTLELEDGSTKRIKGRNLYKYGTFAMPRDVEERQAALDEKHERGTEARKIRDERREEEGNFKYSKNTDSEGNALTEQQAEYFADSKVRDDEGNLQVVYHGTDTKFTVFDRTKARANMDIQGNFFSPWEIDAKGYGSNVEAYYLNITNPADETTAYKALRKFQGQNEAGVKAREYLISQGYDGVNNSNEEYIAFYPEQIKLIDNGKPTNSPDIRFSKNNYDYDTLISKPNIELAVVDDTQTYEASAITRKNVVDLAIKNAKSVGRINENGNAVVYVKDINGEVIVSNAAVRHGLDRRLSLQAPVLEHLGEILQNSIKINETNPKNKNADRSYLLLGAAQNSNGTVYAVSFVVNSFSNSIENIDVMYSANIKKGTAVLNAPELRNNSLSLTVPNISISNLLDIVKEIHPEILSKDVLEHYGIERGNSEIEKGLRYSLNTTEKVNEDLRKENKKLKEALDIAESELKLTVGHKLNAKQIDKLANKILLQTRSKYSKQTLVDNLTKAFDYIANGDTVM